MSAILRWEDPATAPRQDKYARWKPHADELRARPGEWGVVTEDHHTPAQSVATVIRAGYGPFAPKGTYEAATRTVKLPDDNGRDRNMCRVYARYIGTGDAKASDGDR